jgi:hypothetical protein
MLAYPLGDIGLRSHHALIERTIPGELKIFFLAIIGIGDGTDGQDDFNQSVLHSKACLSHITSNSPRVSNFDKNQPVAPIGNRYIVAVATPAQAASDASTVELGGRASPNIHRLVQTILPHRNFSRAEHSIKRSTKSAVLTLDVSVQCLRNTRKLGWVLREICPLQLVLRMRELVSSQRTDKGFSEEPTIVRTQEKTLVKER